MRTTKNSKVLHSILTILFVSLVIFSVSSWADTKKNNVGLEESYKEGSENFKIVRDFLKSAFTEGIWNEKSKNFESFLSRFLTTFSYRTSPNKMPSEYAWLDEYYFRTDGFPKAGVINKWESEITVGLSLPRYSKEDLEWKGYASSAEVAEIIKSVVPELSRVTGLPVRFLKPTTNEHQARLRILIVNNDKAVPGDMINAYPQWDLFTREAELWGAVEFLDDRLSGYLLPKADNTIGMAICKVNVSNDYAVIRSDVATCLIRSMGLTGEFSTEKLNLTAKPKPSEIFSIHDLKLLSLLYCPELKPGMDKYQAIHTLMNNKKCFGRNDK